MTTILKWWPSGGPGSLVVLSLDYNAGDRDELVSNPKRGTCVLKEFLKFLAPPSVTKAHQL